ncbi:MAG: GUN4 domain-containing protein [Cyanobacteria bacterium]|nr:GUN4 domain-containing protein [Cyanobacteria bacterium CG_2015-16_32_12]NCO79281.1 GUN4 domain-containing protein [Cyanobacteria bacterium CG_2015-22_32_23]NCQ05388.1 GUN4 domain-containing protein [Cyanobacteria bacterium CG_2015-09_32_10]NCQ41645.1 GUN4 domain-containing protein [Cyanobacteria bacterium CG_2015-04_32_10]NCS85594.1 GUN4 domain-containing protein [Cyanobacteria bacterium CG_2015-02_32_10]
MSDLDILKEKFNQTSDKNKLSLINEFINQGDDGYQFLREFLFNNKDQLNPINGKIYQLLKQDNKEENKKFINLYFPKGIVKLTSEKNVDFNDLQQLLINQKYQEADALTRVKLCELVGKTAIERKWVYFTEIEKISIADLQLIDVLWQVYSEGKFGYKIQRQMWLSLGKNYPQLWEKLQWKAGNKWTKYPQEFIWDLSAPTGHLPLSNQLRGVRVIDALFSHPAWN